ncbi:hypothetical protein J1N35_012481 [Gossypium stocksii]|uniref:Uncharacterized protein n=1 Tax=Gossypium stocksii TaxID=47602 RepID=A0A9D3W586_9ROSI|nr:hypothetical protein J1N35_012481 [Gossypium stocksii]
MTLVHPSPPFSCRTGGDSQSDHVQSSLSSIQRLKFSMQKLFPGIGTVSLAYAFEIQTWLASVRGLSQRWSFRELLPLLQIQASTLDGETHEITGRIICSLTLQAKLESKCGQGNILFKDTRIYPISF